MLHLIAGLLAGVAGAVPDVAPVQHPAAEIAAAEIAFARQSVVEGLNTAFAANFADHAVGFAPAPRENARADFVGQANPPVILDWYPAYTLAAASGDFGLSTGPSVLIPQNGTQAARHGHYISIWERQPDGEWKVTLDGGVSHDEPRPAIPRLDPASMLPSRLSAPAAWSGTSVQQLLEADAAFSRLSENGNRVDAFARVAAENLRFYRAGHLPVLGKRAALDALGSVDGKWSWKPQGGGIARSGDLGFTYGTSIRKNAEGKAMGAYLRVWQRSPDGWRVIVDRDTPLPPPP